MSTLYYFAANTDSGCLTGCKHKHKSLVSAMKCFSGAGGYLVAVEHGQLRQLNQWEEVEFRAAKAGPEDSGPFWGHRHALAPTAR